MLVAEDVLAAEEHLQLGVGQGFAELSQTIPGIFVEKTQAGVKRCAAPDFQRPVPDGIEHFAGRKHVLNAHARRRLGLMRIAEDGICNEEFTHAFLLLHGAALPNHLRARRHGNYRQISRQMKFQRA